MDETMLSGVVTEIYKQSLNLIGKGYDKLAPKIANACHRYSKNYRDRHSHLKVFCVGMRKPMPLDDVYVAVQFLDEDRPSKYRSVETVEREFRTRHGDSVGQLRDKRQDGTQIANDKQFLMLLGGPGVGKSTFLRKVGLEVLKEGNRSFAHEFIPVFLELKRFTEDSIDIKTLVTEEFKICGYPRPEEMTEAALKSGKLLILLDGLDEVPTANVNNVIRKIGDFVDLYSQNRFIASCRIAAYTGGFNRFTEVEMANFDDSQIEKYINNWFSSASDRYRLQLDEEMKTAEQCWKTLNGPEHQATKELARNPLLLTLLCMVYDNSQNFPRNRADLYEKALNIFLEEWAAEKRVSRDGSVDQYLDIADEKRMLSEIAAENFNNDQLFFTKSELIDQIREFGKGNANTPSTFNARKILDTILVDQGLFVERVNGVYSFSHLTFQEYLTANYIVRDKRSIKGLVTQHFHDERWREVFLLTAGLLHKADSLLERMTAEAVKSINTDKLKPLFQWARRITNPSGNLYDRAARQIFAIRQYFSLWLLNKTYETVKHDVNQNLGFNLKFDELDELDEFDELDELDFQFSLNSNLYQGLNFSLDSDFHRGLNLNPDLYRGLNFDFDLYLDLNLDLYLGPTRSRYPKPYQDFDSYLSHYANFTRYLNLYLDLDFYLNLCGYTNSYFYFFVSSEFGNRFEMELDIRIALVERMEQAEIFKGVDLQRIVHRFRTQQEFIRETRKRPSVKPPEDSIHDTWLSVLDITDDMLAIPREEMESFLQYLRAVQFIVECKEAAGRVSPEVWQKIEDQLLTWDVEEVED